MKDDQTQPITDLQFENHIAAMLILDPLTGKIINANSSATRFYGWTRNELQKMKIQEINTLTEAEVLTELDKVRTKKREHFEFKHRRADGSIRDVEIWSSKFEVNGKPFLHSIIHDITERKQKEEQLNILKATIDLISDAAYWMDARGHFIYVNESGCTMLGYSKEELMNLSVFDVNPLATKERWSAVWEVLRTHKKYISESIHRKKNGSEFPVEISSTYFAYDGVEYVSGFARDISIRKRTEEELQKAQRLESLGILAGGIAHDFNNLLGGIYGYIDLASDLAKEGKLKQYLVKSISTIDRARDLSRQLITFAKGGAPIKSTGHLFPFVYDTVMFVLSGSNVSCDFTIQPDLWLCEYDKNQIGQAIDNLVINAVQAMPGGGKISISAQNIQLSENQHPILSAGQYIHLTFKDSGCGIPKDLISKIFDPFFTTKSTGNGLGLATCYSIIKRHGGAIDIDSIAGEGSTFYVFLPSTKKPMTEDANSNFIAFKGSGTFVILDDEFSIREIASVMLESMGFSVVSCENGISIIDFFRSETVSNRKIAGAILDLTIPGGMGGREVISFLKEISPDTVFFAASGHSNDVVISHPEQFGFSASIRKPFRNSELIEILSTHMVR